MANKKNCFKAATAKAIRKLFRPLVPSRSSRARLCSNAKNRRAFTLMEVTVALAITMVLAVVIAQCITWSLSERLRLTAHQAALELAANVLESARAQPWDKLDQAWADSQAIPAATADLLPGARLAVKLEMGQPLPRTRRVTVEVIWQSNPPMPAQSVVLTTVLSSREAAKSGGTP